MQRVVSHMLVMLVMVAACGDGTAETGGDDVTPAGPGLQGQLIDANEQPLASVQVLACQATSCLYAESGADGRFTFAIDPPADVALKTHAELAKTPRLAAALEPVQIVDDTLVDIGTLCVPDLPAGAVLGPISEDPQTLALGDGLELTLVSADITPSFGEFLYDVAARRLESQHVPTYPDLEPAEVIAVYAMHPFGASSSSPIAVRVPIDLPDGSVVEFRSVGELDGNFVEVVPGHVEEGHATTDPGTGITRITYLVISM
jgi:hypothetical protein